MIKIRTGFFYVQSHIYGKVIKEVDCGKQDKIRRGIFCGKSHIFEKYIKSRFDPARSYVVYSVILLSTDIPFFAKSETGSAFHLLYSGFYDCRARIMKS